MSDQKHDQHCCDAAPPIIDSTGKDALFGHRKLRPNVFGLYASASGFKGTRPTMEDRHRVAYGGGCRGFFAIYDGHGGQESADYAMRHLNRYVRFRSGEYEWASISDDAVVVKAMQTPSSPTSKTADLKQEITRAFAKCEEGILGHLRNINRSDGTTVAAVWVTQDTVYCGNVGDSRIVLCRGGQAVPLTNDHKPCHPEEKKRITAAGGEVHPFMKEHPASCCFSAKREPQGSDRLWPGGFSVSRALGNLDFKDVKRGKLGSCTGAVLSAQPEVSGITLSSDDSFMIIASDGVWDVMTNQKACDYIMTQSKKKTFDPERIANKLVMQCFQLGSEDNISAVVVFFTHHKSMTSS